MLRSVGFEAPRLLILTGRERSRRVAHDFLETLPAATVTEYFEVKAGTEQAVEEAAAAAVRLGADMLVSVGGGSVIDVGKRVQRVHGVPNFVIPTIISNDGLTSPISVLANKEGRKESFPAAVPVGVAVDLDVISRSPRKFLVAAAGDVLSNLSASYDWIRLYEASGGVIDFNDLAYELAVGAAESLIGARHVDFEDDLFLTNLIRGQVYSGLAMGLAGTSRPCSGAEHLISHAIDQLGLAEGELHGIQVGSISLFVLSLLSEGGGSALEFARRVGLPLDWRTLSPGVAASSGSVISLARTVRPGRQTILDSYSDEEILTECEAFARLMSRGRLRG